MPTWTSNDPTRADPVLRGDALAAARAVAAWAALDAVLALAAAGGRELPVALAAVFTHRELVRMLGERVDEHAAAVVLEPARWRYLLEASAHEVIERAEGGAEYVAVTPEQAGAVLEALERGD